MKKLIFKILIISILVCVAVGVMAESVSYSAGTKIRACMVLPNTSSTQPAQAKYILENFNNYREVLRGSTGYDADIYLYNPRKSDGAANYWILTSDELSYNVLKNYDIVFGSMKDYWDQLAFYAWTGGIVVDTSATNTSSQSFSPNNNSVMSNFPYNSSSSYSFSNSGSGFITYYGLEKPFEALHYKNSNNSSSRLHEIDTPLAYYKYGLGTLVYIYSGFPEYDAQNNRFKDTANLLYNLLCDNSSRNLTRNAATLGESLLSTASYYGDMPIVVGGTTYYVNGDKFYCEGFDLTDGANGEVPDENLSRPEYMGDGTFVMYDAKGSLYMCTIDFENDKSVSTNRVTWFKLYTTENTCNETLEFAPVVNDYWAYFVDDKGDLNCVNTYFLDSGKAKYSWVTKGVSNANSKIMAAPIKNSYKDMYGSMVTTINWVVLNDTTATYSYLFCSVPIAIEGEISRRQPRNVEPYNQIIPNYCGFPNITGNNTFVLADSEATTPDDVFISVRADNHILTPYSNNHTSNWDYKINFSGKSIKRNGYIQLNTEETSDRKIVLVNDLPGTTDLPTQEMTFVLDYVPKYGTALRSGLPFATGMFDIHQELVALRNGVVYETAKTAHTNDGDGSELHYINKQAFMEDLRQGTYSRYPQWSYLPHAGFNSVKNPLNQDISIFSNIDWGLPYYATGDVRVFVNGITSYDNDIYVSVTADMGMWKRSAIICLDGNSTPEIHLVDADRNPVRIKYNQINHQGHVREVNYSPRIYQPSVYDTEIAFTDSVFNYNSADFERGIINVNNMNFFNKNGKTQMITSSLPVFVQLEWILDMRAPAPVRTFLPIFPGTCSTLDIASYNNSLGSVSVPISNSAGTNVDKQVYVDLSAWNMVKWYSVLPGNTETFGKPIVVRDKVMVLGDEKDEFGVKKLNKVFTVLLKGNNTGGVKIRENNIRVASLGNDITVNDKLQISANPNKIAVTDGAKVYDLETAKTLILDNSVLEEIDPAGNVAWRLSTIEYDDGNGNDMEFALENPVRARYVFDNGHIAVADASTKIIFVIDKSGALLSRNVSGSNGQWWMFGAFADPYGLLRAGSSLELGYVNDFVFWTDSKSGVTYNHFLVADSTNKRVMDLVIDTDDNGNIINNGFMDNGNVIPYLNWVSYDIIPGNKNNFVSVDITEKVKDASGNEFRAVVAGIANYNTAERNGIRKAKGGSVVMYDYRLTVSDYNKTNQDTYNIRFGRMFDSIGKEGDTIFDDSIYDGISPYISGLKKVAIANLDGRNFNSSDVRNYSELQLVLCDEFGANLYKVNSQEVRNGYVYYFWTFDGTRSVPSRYFGFDNPNYDKLIAGLGTDYLPGRFKPFSSNYYNRVYNGNAAYRTTFAPIKAPIIPLDVKVLDDGKWLILNGYSGNIKYYYQNPYDEIIYEVEGKYQGEAIEVTFDNNNIPKLTWSSNQFESFAIDNFVNVTNPTDEELANWNRVLDEMDIRVYSPQNSPIGYDNNIVGGARYSNRVLKSPKSLDR
ncbi:MAG: hypothetical protein IJS60_06085 [Abditibacteriota bacterium]|nr:hypothetical protein [Abditibacteriota bacterium]